MHRTHGMQTLMGHGPGSLPHGLISCARRAAPALPYWPVAAGAALGFMAWGNGLFWIAVAPLLILVWAGSARRRIAALSVLAYYLIAARGIPSASLIFFGADGNSFSQGLLLWLAFAALMTLPWVLLWRGHGKALLWRVPLLLTLLTVPPIGAVGWFNPLTAAGVLVPGLGWVGLVLCAGLCVALAWFARHPARIVLVILVVHLTVVAAGSLYREPETSWRGVQTAQGSLMQEGREGYLRRALRAHLGAMRSVVQAAPKQVLIFPENLVGLWTMPLQQLWLDNALPVTRHGGQQALLGAERQRDDGTTENVLFAIGSSLEPVYVQRMPVPLAMWNPFASVGARARWFDSGVFEFAGRRTAALLCFEQGLAWPMLMSSLRSPAVIVAPANLWCCGKTNAPDIQAASVRAWSRLFGIPAVIAFNR